MYKNTSVILVLIFRIKKLILHLYLCLTLFDQTNYNENGPMENINN